MNAYLTNRLEPGDHYTNRYLGIRLPNDAALNDPKQLAKLSGPCETIVPAREVSQVD